MDKPSKPRYLESINSRYPNLSNDKIKEYIFEEIQRQMDLDIKNMLNGSSKSDLNELLSYIDGVSTSGKSLDFDSSILGSNPSAPTIEINEDKKHKKNKK